MKSSVGRRNRERIAIRTGGKIIDYSDKYILVQREFVKGIASSTGKNIWQQKKRGKVQGKIKDNYPRCISFNIFKKKVNPFLFSMLFID